MIDRPEDKDPPEAESCQKLPDLRVRPEQMPRPVAPASRKRPLTPSQVDAWISSKELQPPK